MSWRTLILTKPGNCSGERSDCRNKTKITEIEKEMQRVDLLPGAHRRDNQLAGATLLAVALVMLEEQQECAIAGADGAAQGFCHHQRQNGYQLSSLHPPWRLLSSH